MSRIEELRKHISLRDLGLEIAPYFNPVAPKANGYNVLIVDILDTAQLVANAKLDPLVPASRIADIEHVDIVSDASRLADAIRNRGLVGQLKYIVSSHNFEHLPNPIRFLQACEIALSPGGYLTMAVPDCRAIFDHFRLPTKLADWLAAYHGNYQKPSAETHFDYLANKAIYPTGPAAPVGCDFGKADASMFEPNGDLQLAYNTYLTLLNADAPYKDTHCSLLFPDSLELLLRDLRFLDLVNLEVVEITETRGIEFFAHLRKAESRLQPDRQTFYNNRKELMRRINASWGVSPAYLK